MEHEFNFGKNNNGNTQKISQVIDLTAYVPDRMNDVNFMVEAMLNPVIDSFRTISDETSEQQAKNIISRRISEEIKQQLINHKKSLSAKDRRIVHDQLLNEIFGFGPITVLLESDDISEIMINGPNNVFIESKGRISEVPITFRNNDHVYHIIDKIISPLGRRVDESSPMVDARLPDGSRVNIIIPPLALNGPTITIRKFSKDPFKPEDLIAMGSLSADMFMFLKASIKGRKNVLISGGTGSGKTTMLNVLSSFIPETERIVTIEDAAELQLQQKHVVTLESRPPNIEGKGQVTIRHLVANALRMRPDRIVVGEVRGGETLDMLQAMNTGHDGSLTTIHANTPRDCLSRMETLVHMSGVELPSKAIRSQIASAVDLIIQASRYPDGSRKISKISEIIGVENDVIAMQDIFVFEQGSFGDGYKIIGKHVPTGIVPTYFDNLKSHDAYISPALFSKGTSQGVQSSAVRQRPQQSRIKR